MANNLNVYRRLKLRYKSLANPELCNIIRTSVLTEKSVFLEEKYNTIVLMIHDKYNKWMIKAATEAVFTGVTVLDVRTLNYKPTSKRFRGKHEYVVQGYKKAYIRLSKDSVIELGEEQTAITKFTGKNTKNQTETTETKEEN